MAKSVNGIANANAKPNIPMVGPNSSPIVAACTNNVPIMGPVQENDTTANVAAIKKSPSNPPRSALRSNLLASEAGKVNSNAPKKENENTTKRSEEHTSELQSLMRISYDVFCLKKTIHNTNRQTIYTN